MDERWSQCSTTVTRPLLSMIFHEGVSSCSSRAWIVSQTILGMAEIAATNVKHGCQNTVFYSPQTFKYFSLNFFNNNIYKRERILHSSDIGSTFRHPISYTFLHAIFYEYIDLVYAIH